VKTLFLATYFPRPLNPTIGTWALEQAKAFHRAARLNAEDRRSGIVDWEPTEARRAEIGLRPAELPRTEDRGRRSEAVKPLDSGHSALDSSFRVVSGNPWFPKIAGRLKSGIRVYSNCPKNYFWDGVQVDYLPMLFYPFGKLDFIFNTVGEPFLKFGWWSIKRRLMNIVQEFQPDVVYAHHTVPNGYFALRIHQETGIPFFVTDHLMGEISGSAKIPPRRDIFKKVVGSAHRMVSVAGVMRRDMERVFPQSRCEVIHNGINLAQEPSESRGESRESRAVPATTPATSHPLPATAPEGLVPSTLDSGRSTPLVILSCGMFSSQKNFPGLIQAFNLVAEKYPHVVLRIIGDGVDRIKVEQGRIESPFKDRIELLGKIANAEVLRQMKISDIFALISRRELFATVFLEAMAAGLPVIACNDGGIAEVIAGVELPKNLKLGNAGKLKPENANGILVPPRDIKAAARAMEFLILNPEARKQIGAAAHRKIEADLTWDAVVLKYHRLFEEAIKAKAETLKC
jgi:glycosyltransferase involved in cell wall biosynthesis